MLIGHAPRGQIMPLVGMTLLVLMGAAGFAVDAGYHQYEQRLQQSAVDSAAIAGAAEVPYGDWQSAALTDAARNGFTDTSGKGACTKNTRVCVTVNKPPKSGVYTSDSKAVEVLLTVKHTTFFEQVFGIGNVIVTTRAVARLSGNDKNCIYLLNTAGPNNFNGANIQAPNCGIVDNETGSANMNSATINAASIAYAGSTPNQNSATFSGAKPTQSLPANDPCVNIDGCNYLKNNPPSTKNCTSTYNGNGFPLAGCYNGLDVHGTTVNLNPGLYIINGPFNASNATITGSGVTFYITASGSLNLDKANLQLSAPTIGNNSGVLFYQDPANTTDPNFNKVTSDSLTGLLYFPTAAVNFNKTGGGYTVLVFGSANFNSNTMNFTDPPTGGSLPQQPSLVE
jgi:Putative Flp pilus-assembly TadE/G-like